MSAVIGLSDVQAISVTASGRSGAALAGISQEGFSIARGFVITTEAFDGYLATRDVAQAYSSLITAMKEGSGVTNARENLLAVMSEARLKWDHEMEIIEHFREMNGMVTLHLSTVSGKTKFPCHAVTESGVMDGIRRLWARWVEEATPDELQNEFPAIIVQEVIESESSVEIKRKNDGFSVRAVFGQPEGLYDPSISSDHYHFDFKLDLTGSEGKEQKWQHIPTDEKVEKVEVWEDFRKDPKVTPRALDNLADVMSYMLEREEIEAVTLMVTDEDEMIIDDIVASPVAEALPLAMETRNRPHHIMPELAESVQESEFMAPPVETEQPPSPPSSGQVSGPAPQIQTSSTRVKIYVKVLDPRQLPSLAEEMPDGIILLGNWHEPDFRVTLTEIRRLFTHSEVILELPEDMVKQEEIIRAGANTGVGFMLPPCRTLDEVRKARMRVEAIASGGAARPKIWTQVVYPGNLFFFEGIAGLVDAASVDLKRLALNLIGMSHEPQRRIRYDSHSFNEALGHMLASAKSHRVTISIHSPDFASVPSLLESLIRRRADILCASPDEFSITRKIAASVEARMLHEVG